MFNEILQYAPEVGKAILALIALAFAFGVKLMDPVRSSEARGKIGGIIHNTARGVKYAKVFTSPSQPRTQKQLAIRAFMQKATRAWQVLSEANRINWKAYADAHPEIDWTGTSIKKTGFNWFCRLTARLLWLGETQVDTPPAVPAPPAVAAFLATTGVLQSVLTWTPGDDSDTVLVYGVGPHSPGATAKREKAVYLNRAVADTGTVTITGLSPGTYTFFAYTEISINGLISPMVSSSVVITAV